MGDCLTADVFQNNVDVITLDRMLDRLEQAESLEGRRGFLERS